MNTAHPFGHQITQQQLITQFTQLHYWQDKYRLIIQLSKQLPTLDIITRATMFTVAECESQIWIGAQQLENKAYHFYADSDSRIMKGVLAILLTAIEQQTAAQIHHHDLLSYLQKLGIEQQLTITKQHGIRSLIKQIKKLVTKT